MSLDVSDVIRSATKAIAEPGIWSTELDNRTLQWVKEDDSEDRNLAIHKWLYDYGVFQGFTTIQRSEIAKAVLAWVDGREKHTPLTTVDGISDAHHELEEACRAAFGSERSFLSLASKALWLCYPEEIPIFDRYAQNALYFLSKLDFDTPKFDKSWTEYKNYSMVWLFFYGKYQNVLEEIAPPDCRFKVRVFDRVLWVLGKPGYGYTRDS